MIGSIASSTRPDPMDDPPKILLDYSSPEEEEARQKKLEADRREALENYNEATYGQRRPIADAFMFIAIMAAIFGVVFYLFPLWVARPISFCTIVVVAIVRHTLDR